MSSEKDLRLQIFAGQLGLAVLLGLIYFNLFDSSVDLYRHWTSIVRYTFYMLLLYAINVARDQIHTTLSGQRMHVNLLMKDHKGRLLLLILCGCLLVYLREGVVKEEFIVLFMADLACQLVTVMGEQRPVINYGVGMACSYFEGYLMNIIPSDGGQNGGLQRNIQNHEARERVVFPVRKLFVVVTKSLFCPPNLEHFNKEHRPDLATLEGCRSLDDVERDVAGVRNRSYRNSTYRIVRPDHAPDEGVFVVAEFASPLNTFYKVISKRDLYDRLSGVDTEEIKVDFCDQLERTVERHPATREQVRLVHFDDTDPMENLADVLLKEVAHCNPNYDQIIRDHTRAQRGDGMAY